MAYYEHEEQETLYNYDPIDDVWRIYSTYPPHIRRIVERAHNVKEYKDAEGRTIEAKGIATPGQVRIYFDK